MSTPAAAASAASLEASVSDTAPSAAASPAAEFGTLSESDLASMRAVQQLEADELEQQHEEQQKAIEQEQSMRPLIGAVEPLSALEAEYASNAVFLRKIKAASASTYPQLRRVRGDGNCFYRGYVFAMLEWMSSVLRNEQSSSEEKTQVAQLVEIITDSLAQLLLLGYESFTMEDFHEYFLELFTWVQSERPTAEQIQERLADPGLDQYIISYARYLTSAYLKQHEAEYAPFVSDGRTVDQFRSQDIEPCNHESDSLQIVCLSNLLRIGVRVAYLDQSGQNGDSSKSAAGDADSEQLRTYDFPEGSIPRVHLLYRPGHYDVLYPAASS